MGALSLSLSLPLQFFIDTFLLLFFWFGGKGEERRKRGDFVSSSALKRQPTSQKRFDLIRLVCFPFDDNITPFVTFFLSFGVGRARVKGKGKEGKRGVTSIVPCFF